MQTETKRSWWQQLGGMSQGMLFLHGHVIPPDPPSTPLRRQPRIHDAAGQARHRRAMQRLVARRVRAMTALSLFR